MNGSYELLEHHAANLEAVRRRITQACAAAGRAPDSVTLLAASKTFGADHVIALADAGQRSFGENYAQEAIAKLELCAERRPDLFGRSPGAGACGWHFIGPLQSNKTRAIATHFDWVHSVDREKLALRLSQQRPEELPALEICIQVNVSDEDSKSGCSPVEAVALALAVAPLPRLRLRGVMAIPAPADEPQAQRQAFAAVRTVFERCRSALAKEPGGHGAHFDTLSMGMSADLESAIAEGATIVRVGSALFGARPPAGQAVER